MRNLRQLFSPIYPVSFAFGIALLCFLTGCRGFSDKGLSPTGGPGPLVKKELQTWHEPSGQMQTLNQVVVVPLEGDALRKLPVGTDEKLTSELSKALAAATSLDVINLHNPDLVQTALKKAGQGPQVVRASSVAQAAGVQGAVYGLITKFEEPVGSKGGQTQPSAVGFKIWLVRAGSTTPVWSASFEKAEQPLSENLFRLREALKSGVRYKSSRALMRAGFMSAANALHDLREQPGAGG